MTVAAWECRHVTVYESVGLTFAATLGQGTNKQTDEDLQEAHNKLAAALEVGSQLLLLFIVVVIVVIIIIYYHYWRPRLRWAANYHGHGSATVY